MSAVIVIPWWPSECPWRNRWKDEVAAYWQASGLGGVVIGSGVEGAARNRGVEATAGDPILVSDADSIVTYWQAREALRLAAEAPGLVIAHDRYMYLSAFSTGISVETGGRRLAVGANRWTRDATGLEFFGTGSVGGIVALSRETWEQAGGWDEGIVHGYDGAFALACRALVAEQRRVEGDLVHFWHPRETDGALDPPETWAALAAYEKAAEAGPEAMRHLVMERAL